MFTPAFLFKDDTKENFDASEHTKLIHLFSGGFSVLIKNNLGGIYLLEQYIGNPPSEKEAIPFIADVEKNLQIECKTNIFQYSTAVNTQIPKEFFNSEDIEDILAVISSDKNLTAEAEYVKEFDLYNLSGWDKELKNTIFQFFPNIELQTTLSTLLAVLAKCKSKNTALLFIEDSSFYILAKKEDIFLGANRFMFSNEADFLYHTLNFIRVVFQDRSDYDVILGGLIEQESSLFSLTKKYLPQTRLAKDATSVLSDKFHYFFELI